MSTHLYSTVLFVHILGVIVWVGGAVTMNILASMAMKSGSEDMARTGKNAEFVGNRVYMPASILVLATGLWIVFGWDAWSITEAWVLVGLAGIASTIIIGMGFLGPESGRMAKIIEEKGIDDSEVAARTAKLVRIARIDLAILIFVVWDMTYKPFS